MRYIYRIIVHMDYRLDILSAAKRYCEVTGLAAPTVATKVMNDGKFFDRLESGGGCTMKTYQKVMHWFEENMPAKKNGHNGSNLKINTSNK